MSSYWIFITVFGYCLSFITVPFILISKKSPHSMLAWLWSVFLFPYLGPIAYFFWGTERLYRKRLRKRSATAERREKVKESTLPFDLDHHQAELARLLSEVNLYPFSRCHEPRLLVDANEFYPELSKAIQGAKKTIWIEFYIWRDDAIGSFFLNLLVEAAQRGVKVNLLLDEVGCIGLSQNFFTPLIAAGGKFSWFNSIQMMRNRWTFALRNHRKLQIIDGSIAFVGGMNVGQEYTGIENDTGVWRDLQLQFQGRSVSLLEETFIEDWHFATGEKLYHSEEKEDDAGSGETWMQVIESGPDFYQQPMTLSTVALLNHAKKRAWIAAGYFLPHEPLLSALKLCAARGVDVRILVAESSDHPYLVISARSYYEELLEYGIQIFEYSKGTHHAKSILIDDDLCNVGSANLDIRSMRLNFELNVVFKSHAIASRLESVLESDFKKSVRILLEKFSKRSVLERLKENVLRLIAPLL